MSDDDTELRSLDRRLDELGEQIDDSARAEWTPPVRRVASPEESVAPDVTAEVTAIAAQLVALTDAVQALTARVEVLVPADQVDDAEVDALLADLRQGERARVAHDPEAVAAAIGALRTEMRQAFLEVATAWQRWRDAADTASRELTENVRDLLERDGGRLSEPAGDRARPGV